MTLSKTVKQTAPMLMDLKMTISMKASLNCLVKKMKKKMMMKMMHCMPSHIFLMAIMITMDTSLMNAIQMIIQSSSVIELSSAHQCSSYCSV